MMQYRGRAVAALLVAGLLLAVSAGIPSATGAEKIVLSWSSADAIYGPWFYGQEKGFFKKYDLDSELVFLETGTRGVQGLLGGAVDVNCADGNAMMNARFGGADAVYVGVTVGVLTGNVYAAKDITSPAQLKGKKWGVSSFGSEAHVASLLALKAFGLEPGKDVTIVQIGNQGNRFAAIEAGQIQVTTFLPPISAKAEAAGYRKLAQLPDLAPDYFSVGPAVLGKTLRERRPMVKNFLKGLAEATAAYKKDRAGGVAVLQKYLKIDNVKDAELAWDYYAPLHPVNLRPTDKSFQFHLDRSTDPKAKTMKPSDFFDLSLLDELEKEGFMKTLQ
jgi:NitT/TauT family transport system substrate-binding protein